MDTLTVVLKKMTLICKEINGIPIYFKTSKDLTRFENVVKKYEEKMKPSNLNNV